MDEFDPAQAHAVAPIAATPEPPYVAVIFTSVRPEPGGTERDDPDQDDGYAQAAAQMDDLARRQPGYLGAETARERAGITVSYWRTADDARAWKQVAEHLVAQRAGQLRWYRDYRVRVATVERDYGHPSPW